jgi:hypothetical protein
MGGCLPRPPYLGSEGKDAKEILCLTAGEFSIARAGGSQLRSESV